MNTALIFILIGLLYEIHRTYSHHVHLWRRNISNSDVVFGTQSGGVVEPLPCTSATSCGRLCHGFGDSPAFTYLESSCYCYRTAWTEGLAYTSREGAQYFYKQNARLIECAVKGYSYLSAVDVCFRIFDDQQTWLYANDRCWAEGGHLVMIDAAEKIEAFNAVIPSDVIYAIGLEDRDMDGVWTWTKDRAVPYNTTFWYPGEPNGADEYCGAYMTKVSGEHGAVDVHCMRIQGFICEL